MTVGVATMPMSWGRPDADNKESPFKKVASNILSDQIPYLKEINFAQEAKNVISAPGFKGKVNAAIKLAVGLAKSAIKTALASALQAAGVPLPVGAALVEVGEKILKVLMWLIVAFIVMFFFIVFGAGSYGNYMRSETWWAPGIGGPSVEDVNISSSGNIPGGLADSELIGIDGIQLANPMNSCPFPGAHCTQGPYGTTSHTYNHDGCHSEQGAVDYGYGGSILAPEDGEVIEDGDFTCGDTGISIGGYFIFKGDSGLVYTFYHAHAFVNVGFPVKSGRVIGKVSINVTESPCWTGAHVHAFVKHGGQFLDSYDLFVNKFHCDASCEAESTPNCSN